MMTSSIDNASATPLNLSRHLRLTGKSFMIVKWAVFLLLCVNFGLYLIKDITAATHTVTDNTGVMALIAAFAPSTDQLAWLMLILIYELETYWLDVDFENRLVEGLMLLGKLIFTLFILNTIVSYAHLTLEVLDVKQIEPAGGLCGLAGDGLSFLRNLAYVDITEATCGTIPHTGDLYQFPNEPVVTDDTGRVEDIWFRVLDLVEAVVWFLILGLTELSVRLQDRGIYKGRAIDIDKAAKAAMYLILVGVSIFWVSKNQMMYVWDEILWIASFLVLDGNLSQWRQELKDAAEGVEAHSELSASPVAGKKAE